MTTTPNLSLTTWDTGNTQPELLYNSLLALVDSLVPTPTVTDKDLTSPPSSPALGSLYIVGSPATGLWAGKENHLVAYTYANAWMFFAPKEGWLSYVVDEDKQYRYDGTEWYEVSDGGGGAGVSSLNGQTGDVDIEASSGISASTSGGVVTLRGLIAIRNASGTSDTLVLDDAGNAVHTTNGSAVTVTIPSNSSVAYPVGTNILIRQMGTGQVTISPGSGVTLTNGYPTAKTSAQYRSLSIHKVDTDTWVLDGNAATS